MLRSTPFACAEPRHAVPALWPMERIARTGRRWGRSCGNKWCVNPEHYRAERCVAAKEER